jgi:hypothetical protein
MRESSLPHPSFEGRYSITREVALHSFGEEIACRSPARFAKSQAFQFSSQRKPNQTRYKTMSKIVPTISSGVAGPLGVLHLPRLWQKASLEAVGKLHPDYPGCGKGYDQMVLDGLGIDREEFLNHIKTSKPTYIQLESWVLAKKGGNLDGAAVKKLNDAIKGYIHDDGTRKSILDAAGRPDDGSIKDAVNLNNLDDWQTFYAAELK